MTVTIGDDAELPVIPRPRAAGCPLAPPPEFAEWRESGLQQPMWQGRPTWVVSRYEDIRSAVVDPRLSAETIKTRVRAAGVTGDMPVIFARIDDPEHNRLRRMMARDFTWRRCEAMRPQIQELVDRFLDTMTESGPPADLVRDFALPVPSLVISMLLGVPYSDHEFFQHHSTVGLDSRSTDEQKAAATGAMFGYIFELVERKERELGDDLISRLITDYVASGELSSETAAMNAMILLQAGHETTASMIALGTIALLENPDTFELLSQTDDAAVVANIVEELMRYLTIVHSQVDRVATEDLYVGGELVRAGEFLLINLPAGNWDPDFVENPASFDAARNPRGHLGFGYGVHQCIGQNLARVEMQVALCTLARRLPGLALAVPADELRFRNEQETMASRNCRSPGEPVIGGHPGDHGMQISFQALGAVHVGQSVCQPEEETTEKGDHGECLLLDQFPVGRLFGRLNLGDSCLADGDELIHQTVEYRAEVWVTRGDHHQLEPSPCPRPLRLDGGAHGLCGERR
jgi:cytochrome P450